jgi:long-chain acyl-CoA synthetase
MLPIWLGNNGGDRTMSVADAANSPLVIAEVQKAIDRVNKNFSQAESIRKFVIIGQELSEETGHLTPSLKIKREIVQRDFSPAIEELYEGNPATGENGIS